MSTLPSVSVIIPTRDRPARLARCLGALAALDSPREVYEIIVVDDGGATPLEPIVNRFRDRVNLHLECQENTGPAGARNAGAELARGHILAFTDDDCEPDPLWLEAIRAASKKTKGALVGGRIVNGLPRNAYASASQELVSFLYEYYRDRRDSRFFCSNNFALPSDRFQDLGGFDASFPRPAAEDRELCERWLRHGYPMHYEAQAVVHHYHDMNLRGFLRQHFRYGEGAFALNRLRLQRGDDALGLEPLSFYTALLKGPRVDRQVRMGVATAPLLAASQLAGAAGFYWARFQASRSLSAPPSPREAV